VATKSADGKHIIAAGEVGVFSVCPQSWKLKSVDRERPVEKKKDAELGKYLHKHWSSVFEESLVLSKWIRYLAVLVCTALAIFLLVRPHKAPLKYLLELSLKNHALQLVLLVMTAFLLIRTFGRAARRRREDTGFTPTDKTVSIEGSATLPAREYVSTAQGLAGKPDALLSEDGWVVPIEMKPLAKKLRDRYVAQLLVYMRLVEEFEGKRPPYGYLFLGPKYRRVKVDNTEAKQRWLQGLVEEMRKVLDGAPAKATPHPIKCSKCDVRHRCTFRGDAPHASDGESG
jgi:CRISPR/Cas system-associated exonuclease Cas4 (RecB family)